MSWYNKVIWSEGMFLRPAHFQQHNRYVENLVEMRQPPPCFEQKHLGAGGKDVDEILLARQIIGNRRRETKPIPGLKPGPDQVTAAA